MKANNFDQFLTNEDKLHIEFTEDHGDISRFVVEYLSLIDLKWRSIMRIDNCHHGKRPHKHTFYSNGKETFIYLKMSANDAFTEAKRNITIKFRDIKENYLING